MKKVINWAKNLGWKWRILILAALIVFVVVVVVPTAVYYSRDRKPANYSKTHSEATATYQVHYDSGEGLVNDCKFTVKMIETGVVKDGETTFHLVTVYDPFPKRKVRAIIVGSARVTLSGEEMWRNESDLHLVHKQVMQKNLPIVNTAFTQMSYKNYANYPGWPYHLNDVWTYQISYDTDTPLQPNWTDTFQAVVVADDAPIEVKGQIYICFKVVHSCTATTNGTTPGGGVGYTYTEYWCKDFKSIGPVKIEDAFNFKGIETQTMTETPPQLVG